MITVVCSTRAIDENYEKMVRRLSGLKYSQLEFLIYENQGTMSLTEVYNKGLAESKNHIVVFMHDDIEILTKNWGQKLINHYKFSDYGILGVAGTRSLDESGVWWNKRETLYGCVSHTDGIKTWLSEYSLNFGTNIKDAVVVDGVFFSCHKDRIQKKFNEEYKGFHFYDISFCFENFMEDVRVGVHSDISIVHKSIGEVSEQWNDNRLLFLDKEEENLPQTAYIGVSKPMIRINLPREKKLAIVIPTKNKVDNLLIPCIESIISNTTYTNYNIYVGDTGSSPEELEKTKEYLKSVNTDRDIVRLIEYDYYNFAKINNDLVKTKIDTDTELLLFCNNDIEMLNDAISEMAKIQNEQPKIGTIGCRLHYEDGSIQHLGVSLQTNKNNQLLITHKYIKWDFDNIKQHSPESFTHGNTAAFMMVSKKLFDEIGGFNEKYVECFEDVEFNLTCLIKKRVNVTTSRGVCYHLESQTRKREGEENDLNRLLSFINENSIIKETFNKID